MEEAGSEERVTELEIQLAHQQKLLQDLDEVVTAQQSEIDRLGGLFELFKSRLLRLEEKDQGSSK